MIEVTTAQDLRVALVQGDTRWHDIAGNLAYYGALIAPLAGVVDLVVLPETFTSGFSNDALAAAEDMDGSSVAWLRQQAGALDAAVCGSVQIRDRGDVYNRLLVAFPDATVRYYDKRHLFRMAGEHQRYAPGRDRLTFAFRGWRICPLVCYDLRFPVFVRNRFGIEQADGFDYDLALFVANWPSARAYAWSTLLRARAIENLAFVVGVNRVGRDGNDIDYGGASVVLDPAGQPLIEAGAEVAVLLAKLDSSALLEHRRRFPAHLDADRFEIE